MPNCPSCNTDQPNIFFNGRLYAPDADNNVLIENTVERADGTFHTVGPNGYPRVAPDLTVCDAGTVRPVAELETVVTETTLPVGFVDPGESAVVQHQITGPGGWPISFDTTGLSPVVSLTISNPDMCREARGLVEFTNTAAISLAGGYSAGDIRFRVYLDQGDGNLQLVSSGTGVNHAGDGPGHVRPLANFINTDRWSTVRPTVPIPAGGSVTVRMQTDMTTTLDILSPWTGQQVNDALPDGFIQSTPRITAVGVWSGRVA